MERRKYLSTICAATSIGIAGCASSDPSPRISDIWVDETTLTAEIENPELADRVEFDVDDGDNESTSISEENPTAEYEIGNRETIGTEDQNLMEGRDIVIRVIDDEDEVRRSETWSYTTDLTIVDAKPATELDYNPENYKPETTPIIEIKNEGTGPARIEELALFDFNQNIDIVGENEDTGFARTIIAREPYEDKLQPVEGYESDYFFIPSGESLLLAIDGIYTHEGDEPEQTDETIQVITLDVRWLFGEKAFDVRAQLSGGMEFNDGYYHFNDFSIEGIDRTGPLH